MKSKILNIALIGKTNSGKSTLINKIIKEKISIENKKINTTLENIIGVYNNKNIQLIFYDTPGLNLFKVRNSLLDKSIYTNIWEALNKIDLILYLIDTYKYNYSNIIKDLQKVNEIKKPIIIVFNKIDLVKKEKILIHINKIDKLNIVDDFFNISAKYNKNIDKLIKYLCSRSYYANWIYSNNEISNKDDIFITNECTRNSILKYLHKEIPYNISIKNLIFKYLKKNELKIKQNIFISNLRYKSIILGKNGKTIKVIREDSQNEISNILKCKVHLYLHLKVKNDK